MTKEIQQWLQKRGLEQDERLTLLLSILSEWPHLECSIKWNAPNFALHGADRITFQVPPNGKVVNLILHRGAVASGEDLRKMISDPQGLLQWRSADRAIMTFDRAEDVHRLGEDLRALLHQWLTA